MAPKTLTELEIAAKTARLAALDEEIRTVELETKMILLSQAKRTNADFLMSEETRKHKGDEAQRTLLATARMDQQKKAGCSHKVGGFGNEDTYNGDGKPSVVMSELPIAGFKMIVCYRCLGDWKTPDPNLRVTNPELYVLQLADWREALKLERESVSRPMGGPIFAFEKDGLAHHPVIQ